MRPYLGRLPRGFFARLSALFCGVVLLAAALAAPNALTASDTATRRQFNLPRGDAEKSLKLFSQQSGRGVIFPTEALRNIQTNAVEGEFTPREALNRMVDGTGLEIGVEEKTGAFAIRKGVADPNAPRVAPAVASSVRPERIETNGSAKSNETVVMSPFEVTADDDRGYHGANTMSGTRLNTKIEDLASSTTVVTKEQMADFAMLDINDVFLYEASTEGTGTFTDFSVDRNGSVLDNTQLNPNSANRVRGVGPANVSFGNFETGVPLDPINIDGVEISRGPNSTVFGLGNASGTVNMVPASANLSRDRSQLGARLDNFDGYRASLDLNRVLKKNMLAVRGSVVVQHDGFVRKPSGTDTKRYNGMVRFRPFKHTTFIGSYSYYHIDGNRPNTTMPRDAVTAWKNAGSPTWDPVTATAKINGVPVSGGPWTTSRLPAYFSNSDFLSMASLFIDNTGAVGWWGPSRTTSNATSPGGNQNIFFVNSKPEPVRATQPLFSSDPSVNSKDLYDWSSINLAAMNWLKESTGTTHLQLEQIFLDTPRHLLALQAGYFREDSDNRYNYIMGTPGSNGAQGFMYVDVNERMVDGSPNPFFLRPFIGIARAQGLRDRPAHREISRVQLAYRLDLRREEGLLRWLGMHQFSGYGEYKYSQSRTSTYRDMIVDYHSWYPPPTVSQASSSSFFPGSGQLVYYRYYVGDNVGQNADQASHDFARGIYNFRWGNGVTGQFRDEPTLIGPGFWPGATTAYSRNVLKTRGAVLQSQLLQGRVVTTLGLRDDRTYDKNGADAFFNYSPDNGITLDYNSIKNNVIPGDYARNQGKTKTAGVVVKPTRWLYLHANKSDSFQPAGYAQTLFLQTLSNPTGEGKDYGFALNLSEGKLVIRINRYQTTQFNSRNSSNRAISVRLRALDFDSTSGSYPQGLTERATVWVTAAAAAQGRTLTPDEIIQQVASFAGLDIAYLNQSGSVADQSNSVAATADVVAKGTEVELNYNPSSFWTLKLNVAENESMDSNISADTSAYIAQRTPVWEKIIDPDLGRPWFTERYGGTRSAKEFLEELVIAPLNIANATEGKSRPQIRKYRANLSTSYRLAGLTDHRLLKRFTFGGALRWEDKGAIGYYGVQQLPAIITALDPNRPIYDKARLYADAFVAYRTRLLSNKVGATFQLNVRNLQEGGRLQAISAFPDGTPNGYRIIDPRQFILTLTFDL